MRIRCSILRSVTRPSEFWKQRVNIDISLSWLILNPGTISWKKRTAGSRKQKVKSKKHNHKRYSSVLSLKLDATFKKVNNRLHTKSAVDTYYVPTAEESLPFGQHKRRGQRKTLSLFVRYLFFGVFSSLF